MLTTIAALLLVLLIFTPSSAIWLIGSFIHKPTLNDLLYYFQFLVSHISVLFKASSTLENSIFSPRKAVSSSSAFPGESSLLTWRRSGLSTLDSWDSPGAQMFPSRLVFQILPSQQVHWSLLHSSPVCQLIYIFFFVVWTQREPIKTHFV